MRRFKRLAALVLLLLLALAGLFAYTFFPITLEPDPNAADGIGRGRSVASELPEVMVSIVKAGRMSASQAFSYRGGSWSANYENGMMAVLVRHPTATFFLDTGFGSRVDEHWKTIPALMRALSTIHKETTLKDQLAANGIAPEQLKMALITHSHWDHISGLEDFPGLEVWMPQAEFDFIKSGRYPGLADQMIDHLKVKTFEFRPEPYENFNSSYDLFGDRSIILVPLPGHTPGSLGMFVNLRSGRRYFFIGDLTWSQEGIDLPAERPWLARKLVDMNEAEVRSMIRKVHALKSVDSSLTVVPAHDRRLHDRLPSFPNWLE
jgi:N-acyl homoserine lactone hydrolase